MNLTRLFLSAFRFEVAIPKPEELERLWGFSTKTLPSLADRILFVNGMRDGWSAGGITNTLGSGLPVVNIEDGAHHSEMKEGCEADPPSMRLARDRIEDILMGWMTREEQEHIRLPEANNVII